MDCRPVAIPLAANEKFEKDDGEKKANSSIYRSLIGSLLYLTSTRPDIMFSASLLSRFMQEPRQVHFGATKHALRYLQGTMDYGIMYKFGGDLNLIAYFYSDWAGSTDGMKSTSGYAFLFGSTISSWLSKKKSFVALSTAEADYVSTAKATSQANCLRRIFEDIGEKQNKGIVMYCDNKSVIAIAKN
ncbi:secreted RxLR effector protein 161-like [Solanum stenotomum]|uniref:secreted RxLR effector protein 161-like n=1 Tax=Solanum stenotomum TaxID=172797 RepID=UPI0020D016E6|nr:secreted RxLR effector protein 161-like [Solanum stenotomum]